MTQTLGCLLKDRHDLETLDAGRRSLRSWLRRSAQRPRRDVTDDLVLLSRASAGALRAQGVRTGVGDELDAADALALVDLRRSRGGAPGAADRPQDPARRLRAPSTGSSSASGAAAERGVRRCAASGPRRRAAIRARRAALRWDPARGGWRRPPAVRQASSPATAPRRSCGASRSRRAGRPATSRRWSACSPGWPGGWPRAGAAGWCPTRGRGRRRRARAATGAPLRTSGELSAWRAARARSTSRAWSSCWTPAARWTRTAASC